MLQSVTVSFYAADGDGSTEEHHRFTTSNLAPTTGWGGDPTGRMCRVIELYAEKDPTKKLDEWLRVPGHEDTSDEKNLYEAYVRSSRFRDIHNWNDGHQRICNSTDDKHVTRYAHFEVRCGFQSGGMRTSFTLTSDPKPASRQWEWA
jgi:hypothetical protein